MPKMALLAAYVELNSVDRSDWCNKIELQIEVDEKDVSTFKSQGWKEVIGGQKSGGLGVSFRNDLADGALDELMWDLLGTVVPFAVRASQDAVGVSNPEYSGFVHIKAWNPIAGAVGDVNEASYTYSTSGPVNRTTS